MQAWQAWHLNFVTKVPTEKPKLKLQTQLVSLTGRCRCGTPAQSLHLDPALRKTAPALVSPDIAEIQSVSAPTLATGHCQDLKNGHNAYL